LTNKLIYHLCAWLLVGLIALAVAPETLRAQQPHAAADSTGAVTLDFKDIELKDLIQTISEMTGKNFLYDETVRGKVTIISPKKMSLDEAYNLFLTVLNVKGFTVVPSGKVNKIVPTKEAKESNLPTVSGGGRRGTEQFITRLIPLNNTDAVEMAAVLAPLVPKTSSIVAYPASNTLIVTDSAANIDRLMNIVRELDVPLSSERLEVIPLHHGNAEDISKLATEVMSQRASSQPTRRRTTRNVQTAGTADKDIIKVLAYARTNSLVVVASDEDMLTIKELVAKLDSQPTQERSYINVYYLENADAETLAKTMNEIVTGVKTQVTKTPAKSQTPQAAQAAAALSSESVSITFDKPTNSLIINALPEDYEILRKIIAQLDIKRKQVYVEALILELSMDATKRLGASLQGAVNIGNDSAVFGTSNLNTGPVGLDSLAATGDSELPSLLSQAVNGILLGGLFNPISVTGPDGQTISIPALSALIDLSKTDTDVSILSAPRLLTSDNEEAEILVGSNVPVITSRLTDTGGSTGLAQSVSVERQDVALILRFTPQVTEGNLVRLNVYQETTDIAANSVGNVNEVGPTFTKRTIRNTVLAENGRTVVLGGLIGTNVQESVSKVPLLGDLPLLGWLFKRTNTSETKTNLLIFITPRIIRNSDDLARITQRSRGVMEEMTKPEMLNAPQMDSLDESMRIPVLPAGEKPQEKTGAQ